MDRIENRFLIYKEFPNDAPIIFKKLTETFNFKINSVSIYGIHFFNNRCMLDITYESGIQLWLKVPKYNIVEMIPILAMFKGDEVFERYKNIISKDCSIKQMIELVDFLIEYFSDELKE